MVVPFGPEHGASLLGPMGVFGNWVTTKFKSGNLFVTDNWKEMTNGPPPVEVPTFDVNKEKDLEKVAKMLQLEAAGVENVVKKCSPPVEGHNYT